MKNPNAGPCTIGGYINKDSSGKNESLERDSHQYWNLAYNRLVRADQKRKDKFFDKWGYNQFSKWGKMRLYSYLTLFTKINIRWFKNWNVKDKSIKRSRRQYRWVPSQDSPLNPGPLRMLVLLSRMICYALCLPNGNSPFRFQLITSSERLDYPDLIRSSSYKCSKVTPLFSLTLSLAYTLHKIKWTNLNCI